jgi:uncharacterized protein
VAVAGSGVAGPAAAFVLGRADQVTLSEADGRLGGYADTRDGRELAVDTELRRSG